MISQNDTVMTGVFYSTHCKVKKDIEFVKSVITLKNKTHKQ